MAHQDNDDKLPAQSSVWDPEEIDVAASAEEIKNLDPAMKRVMTNTLLIQYAMDTPKATEKKPN